MGEAKRRQIAIIGHLGTIHPHLTAALAHEVLRVADLVTCAAPPAIILDAPPKAEPPNARPKSKFRRQRPT